MGRSGEWSARVGCGIAVAWGLGLAGCASPMPPEKARTRVNAVLAGHDTRETLDAFLGTIPKACTESGPGLEVCTWRLRKRQRGWRPIARALSTGMRINVVCELPLDGSARSADSCAGYSSVRGIVRLQRGTLVERRAKEAHWKAEAQQAIDQAQTFWQLVDLVGAGPRNCQLLSEPSCLLPIHETAPTMCLTGAKDRRWIGHGPRSWRFRMCSRVP